MLYKPSTINENVFFHVTEVSIFSSIATAMDPLEHLELDTPNFFISAGITRQACDDWLRRFQEGSFTPLPEQSNSSYSVCVGQDQERIMQFRLKSSPLDADAINLAQ